MTFKHILASSVAALAIGVSATAVSAEDTGFYVGTNIGANFQQDQDSTSTGRNLDLSFDNGEFYAGQVGYKFAGNDFGRFRTEFELSYRENDVDDIVFNNNPQVGSGEQDVLAGLVNVYYDFTSVSKKFVPFVGLGLGVAELDSNVAYNGGAAFLNDSDTTLAYQAVIGGEYKLTEAVSLTGDARYFGLDDPDLTRFGGPPPAQFTSQDSEYDSFTISAGLRYNF